MKKYVLYGAGNYGRMILNWLSVENVAFFVDNSKLKQGQEIDGIKVFSLEEKQHELEKYKVIISANVGRDSEMAESLLRIGIKNFLTYKDIERDSINKRLVEASDNIEIYNRTIEWIKNNTIEGKGIINNSGLRKSYPEVTGYYIPSLLKWGHKDLAIQYANWLCEIQKQDGSWFGTEDDEAYVFDTAQIVKGLLAIREILPNVDGNIEMACEWLVKHIDEEGRLWAEDNRVWGDNKTLSELIHLYCLSPIKEAGQRLHRNEFIVAAEKSLNYYIEKRIDDILNFNLLSHFYAYVIEGLLDMGRNDIAEKAMQKIELLQKDTGAVPAYVNVDWVCSTGLFQFALIWFRLGSIECGEKAFIYACKLQNPSGGWFGSYISENNMNEENDYFPINEISWAAKYFLDALYYRNRLIFDHRKDLYIDRVDKESSTYKVIHDAISDKTSSEVHPIRIADIGCGRGSYLKNLVEDFEQVECYGIDISPEVLKTIYEKQVKTVVGSLTDIPFENSYFDVVYACESLEHAVDEKSAIKELARVTKNGGLLIIVDKHIEAMGIYVIERWEKFFDVQELKEELLQYCSDVRVVDNIGHKGNPQVMTAWIGKVEK